MLTQLLNHGVPPIVAILRGIRPEEVVGVAQGLVAAGIRIIEVPLNSPKPLHSLEALRLNLPQDVLIGAGTVTSVAALDEAATAGARLIVAPNMDLSVIARAVELRLDVMPGVLTPTEAFAAVAAGARDLKLFPASSLTTTHVTALNDVLPDDCRVWAVGGTNATNLASWLAAGAFGIGVGAALYRPGVTPEAVRARGEALVHAWQTSKT